MAAASTPGLVFFTTAVAVAGADVAAQRRVANAFQQLSDSSLKLATFKRINRGSDEVMGGCDGMNIPG